MWHDSPHTETRPTAVIVEDEEGLLEELRDALGALWPELLIVGVARDGLQAMRLIAAGQPDIVFIDIQIPEPSGLEVARYVGKQCHVVFVTAYDQHAVEAFERGAADYILKPVVPTRLALSVERLKSRLAQPPADRARLVEQIMPMASARRYLKWITATVGKSMRLVTTDEIVFFQADQKFTRVVLAGSEVLIKKSLKDLLAELDPEQFWQIHRSTVVNALEIASMEPGLSGRWAVRLKSRAEQLPVSEAFLKKFRQLQ